MSSDKTFSKYIVPSGPIDQEASDIHGLYLQKNKLGQLLIILNQLGFLRKSNVNSAQISAKKEQFLKKIHFDSK